MVAKRIEVHHEGSQYDLEVDMDNGLEVLRIQLYSLTLVPPENQKIMGLSEGPLLEATDLSRLALTDGHKLVLVGQREAATAAEEEESSSAACMSELPNASSRAGAVPDAGAPGQADADEAFARQLQEEEDAALAAALMQQEKAQLAAAQAQHRPGEEAEFRSRLEGSLRVVLQLEEKAVVALFKAGEEHMGEVALQDALLQQLLVWFKSWFTWVDSPACEMCNSKTSYAGHGQPTSEDLIFVRYNHPGKVDDWTDHVWTECFSLRRNRWVHLDPCEAAFDTPLLYESGWGKRLTYAVALSRDGVADVTRRYTRHWDEVKQRRIILPEESLRRLTDDLTQRLRAHLAAPARAQLELRDRADAEELLNGDAPPHNSSSSSGSSGPSKDMTLPGRQTGSVEWRQARGETGPAATAAPAPAPGTPAPASSGASGGAPARDEHVATVLRALGDYLASATATATATGRAAGGGGEGGGQGRELAGALKELLVAVGALRALPYKSRHLRLRRASKSMGSFFEALHFCHVAGSADAGGLLDMVLPSGQAAVAAAVALPVAEGQILRLLHEAQHSMLTTTTLATPTPGGSSSSLGKEDEELLSAWTMRGRRISGGAVEADNQNAPRELASAAFDGLVGTKWLNPDSTRKSAWISYRLPPPPQTGVDAVPTATLAAYAITAADDCPERDPCSWLLEGSLDGATWQALDERQDVVFRERHACRVFVVAPQARRPCRCWRFRFLAVPGGPSCALQLACIDLFSVAEEDAPRPRGAAAGPAPLGSGGATGGSMFSAVADTRLPPGPADPGIAGVETPLERKPDGRADIAAQIKIEFEALLREGHLSANQAAVEAVKRVRARAQPDNAVQRP
eukprot:jgi/Mesen1/9976/ME000072S09393